MATSNCLARAIAVDLRGDPKLAGEQIDHYVRVSFLAEQIDPPATPGRNPLRAPALARGDMDTRLALAQLGAQFLSTLACILATRTAGSR